MRKLLFILVAAAALWPGIGAAQQPLSGDVPSDGGFGLAVWAGGSVEELEATAATLGCDLDGVWVTVGGDFVGHIVGAPSFVNADFAGAVGTTIAPGTVVVLVCQPGTVAPSPTPTPAGTPIEQLLLTVDDFAPGVAVLDEGCITVVARPNAGRVFDGTAGYLEFQGTVLLLATSDVLVFASNEAAAGHLQLLQTDGYNALVADFALVSGMTVEEYKALVAGTTSRILPGLGDGGVAIDVQYTSGATLEFAATRVGNVMVQIATVQPTEGAGVVAQNLAGLLIPRVQAALATGIDTSACVPV